MCAMSPSRARATGLLALTLLLTALPAIAPAATSSKQVWVTAGTSCRLERFKPRQIELACADGTEALRSLKWSRWNRAQASGKGTDDVVSCNPDCAAGHESAYPVNVTLGRPKSCKGRVHPVFSLATLRFPQAHPGTRRTETDHLGCPL
jgi:hypothetical protein